MVEHLPIQVISDRILSMCATKWDPISHICETTVTISNPSYTYKHKQTIHMVLIMLQVMTETHWRSTCPSLTLLVSDKIMMKQRSVLSKLESQVTAKYWLTLTYWCWCFYLKVTIPVQMKKFCHLNRSSCKPEHSEGLLVRYAHLPQYDEMRWDEVRWLLVKKITISLISEKF